MQFIMPAVMTVTTVTGQNIIWKKQVYNIMYKICTMAKNVNGRDNTKWTVHVPNSLCYKMNLADTECQ